MYVALSLNEKQWKQTKETNLLLRNQILIWMWLIMIQTHKSKYRSGTLNSNMVNSKFHLIQSFFEIFARFLSFHV